MTKIKVLLADDHTVVRQGLRALLQAEPDIETIAEAGTGRQAVELTRTLKPDVVVMDIAMPMLNGLEATRQILKSVQGTRVLILSSYSDDEYVYQLSEAGAAGYLLKQAAIADLVTAIRKIKAGQTFFSAAISRRLMRRYRETVIRGVFVKKWSDGLTSREMEVLQLIVERSEEHTSELQS